MVSVLFVCVQNAGRSQMAEAFAKQGARERGLVLNIWSAGSKPVGAVHPEVAEAMAQLQIDLSAHRPKGLDAVPARTWDYVVTMGCGDSCAAVPSVHHEDWALTDPHGQSVNGVVPIRDDIRQRVDALLTSIENQTSDNLQAS
jgi:arsenate reductase (thioredoxin)